MKQPGCPLLVLLLMAAPGLAAHPQAPPSEEHAPPGPAPHGRLPLSVGPAPAIVALSRPGRITLWLVTFDVRPVKGSTDGAHDLVYEMGGWEYDLKDVRACDTDGNFLDPKDLPRLLQGETHALAAKADAPIDPLYLRWFRRGTLLFIFPDRFLRSWTCPAVPAKERQHGVTPQ
jgi:hypothetical protein